jgi:hypothetical protein
MAQVVVHLLSKYEVLDSNLSTAPTPQKRKRNIKGKLIIYISVYIYIFPYMYRNITVKHFCTIITC